MSKQTNSIKNLVWGVFGNFLTTFIAILIPRLFIVNYGSEVNGLLSSIKQIYVYLALLEMGVGEATVVALYAPVGRQDHRAINGILAATDRYYKKIGVLYTAAIVALGCLYPLLLDTTVPYHVCTLVIMLQGSGSVISYLVLGKYQLLLRVDNRSYITTNMGTVATVFTDLARILLVLQGKSILTVQTICLVFNLLKMLWVRWYIRRHYSWLDLKETPNYAAISQRKAVLSHQIAALVFHNTDVLILTFACGLETVSIYSLYMTISAMVNNILQIVSNSVKSAMGQVLYTDRSKFIKLQAAYETYYLALVFSLFTIFGIFILPFIGLYTRGADLTYVDGKLTALFMVYQLLNYTRVPCQNVIWYLGKFKETQGRAWAETAINLVLSLVCVFRFGIYGVLFGTIGALLYRANDMILYTHRQLLHTSPWPTYRRILVNSLVCLICVWVFQSLPLAINGYVSLLLNGLWVSVAVIALFIGIGSLAEKEAGTTAWSYAKPILRKLFRQN